MSYTVAWARDVNTTGFEACVHERVFFSGAHLARMVRFDYDCCNRGSFILGFINDELGFFIFWLLK